MNITEEQAQEVLAPYQDDIRTCITSAWTDYHNQCSEIKHKLTPRSRANIIFDFIVHNVRQTFQGRRNVLFSDKKRLFLLNLENKVVIRFKKLKHKMASGIPTQQTLDFFSQIEIPEIPPPERFVVGYQLNSIQTEIKNISVVYPKNTNQYYWTYDLSPMEAKTFEYPPKQTSMDQEIATKTERIKIKKDKDAGKVENGQSR